MSAHFKLYPLMPYQVSYYCISKDLWYLQDFDTQERADQYAEYLRADKDNTNIYVKIEEKN